MAEERPGCAECVRAVAADVEGRAALRAVAARLGAGGDVLAAVEERSVNVVLSAWRPIVVDTRDNLSRRLAGQAASDAMFRVAASPIFQLSFRFWTVLYALALPLSAVGVLSARAALCIWAVQFMFFITTWALFSWSLLVMIWRCVAPLPRVRNVAVVSPALLALLARFQYQTVGLLVPHGTRASPPPPLRARRLRCRACTCHRRISDRSRLLCSIMPSL